MTGLLLPIYALCDDRLAKNSLEHFYSGIRHNQLLTYLYFFINARSFELSYLFRIISRQILLLVDY